MRRFLSNPTVEDPPTPPGTAKIVAYITTSHHQHLIHIDLDRKKQPSHKNTKQPAFFLTSKLSTRKEENKTATTTVPKPPPSPPLTTKTEAYLTTITTVT
jgi:hypothetical protein